MVILEMTLLEVICISDISLGPQFPYLYNGNSTHHPTGNGQGRPLETVEGHTHGGCWTRGALCWGPMWSPEKTVPPRQKPVVQEGITGH